MSASRKLRLIALIVVLAALFLLVKATPLGDYLTREQLSAAIEAAGVWGAFLFLAVFAVGQLIYIPGLVFVPVGVYAYGPLLGGGLCYVGAVLSVTVSFLFARSIGGRALEQVDRPLMKRIMATLDQRPIFTVALLRLVFMMYPAVNYALGLSGIRLRDYVIGSALGLALPIALATLFCDLLFGR